jgi:hypothetical protein
MTRTRATATKRHARNGNKGTREDLTVVSLLAMRTLAAPFTTVLQRVSHVSAGTETTQSFHTHMQMGTPAVKT